MTSERRLRSSGTESRVHKTDFVTLSTKDSQWPKLTYFAPSKTRHVSDVDVSYHSHVRFSCIFTWFSFFSSLCKLINVKPSDITSEAFVLLKEKLCDCYIQYWSDRIKTFSKMDTYCLLKQRFGFENYIRDVNIRSHRIILSKMRISNHRLAIETGRFSKTPRNERLCLFCKANNNFSEIEDEQHVLLRCSRYTEIRKDLFDRVRKCCPRIDLLNDENKFMYLLNSSGSTIKDVARFFHSAYKARSA